MKKLFLTLTVFTLTTIMSFAQTQFGVTAGVNMSNVSGSDLSNTMQLLGVDGPNTKLGIRIGFSASKEFSDALSLNTGVIYSTKGWAWSSTSGGGWASGDQLFSFIELPVNLAFSVSDKFSLMGGFYSAFLIASTTTWDGDGAQGPETDLDSYSSIDVGIGLGAQFYINDNISINAGYQMGVTPITEGDTETDQKYSNIIIGMTYNFGG